MSFDRVRVLVWVDGQERVVDTVIDSKADMDRLATLVARAMPTGPMDLRAADAFLDAAQRMILKENALARS